MLVDAARVEKGSRGGGRPSEVTGCRYQETVRIEVRVGMLFQICSGHGRGGNREFMNDTDRPAFLERELMELCVDGYQ